MKKLSLHVHSHNSKQPDRAATILLHGLGSSGEDWSLQVPRLLKSCDVYAVDLPGHGASAALPGWPRIENYSSAVARWIKTQELQRVHVVGLSLGGLVALQLGVDHPDHVATLTIVNAFSRMQVNLRGGLHSAGRLLLLLVGKMDWLGSWVAAALFPEQGQEALREMAAARIASSPRRAYLQAVNAIARFNLDERLHEIQAPTLIVAGGLDRIVALSAKKLLAERIESAQFTLITGSGHVTPVDASEEFNSLLLNFLAKN